MYHVMKKLNQGDAYPIAVCDTKTEARYVVEQQINNLKRDYVTRKVTRNSFTTKNGDYFKFSIEKI